MKTMDYYASFRKQVEDTKRNLLECLVRLKRERQTIVGYGVPARKRAPELLRHPNGLS